MTLVGRFMKRILIIPVICLLVAVGLMAMASEEDVNTIDHQITITTKDNSLSVIEILTIQGNTNESYNSLTIWIQSGATEVDILINSEDPDSINQNDSEYICNISSFGIKKEDSIQVRVTYLLSKNVEFTKKLIRATDSISVTFDQEEIFTGTNLAIGGTIDLQLYQPVEPTLDWYITVLIILLVILIVVIGVYSLRKQKSAKIKEIAGGSEELLTTKKTLLMSLLKEIEKQHRTNQISDDTYHKLKERYKQEAVEAMKQLEDMKPKG
jgi:uncharacterized membrane protein